MNFKVFHISVGLTSLSRDGPEYTVPAPLAHSCCAFKCWIRAMGKSCLTICIGQNRTEHMFILF